LDWEVFGTDLPIVERGSIFPNLATLPKKFTCEAEIKVDNPNRAMYLPRKWEYNTRRIR
jgi:hypothetical protein